MKKGRLPPSSDSSPGALPVPRSLARRSANLRKKGRLPASSDSSPGAFRIPKRRAQGSADSIRPPNAMSPAPEPESIRFDEEECKEEEVAPGAGAETEGDICGSSSHIAENIPDALEARAYAVQDYEDARESVYITIYQPPAAAQDAKKWHKSPLFRVLLAILLIAGVVALVVYLAKPAGVTPPPTAEPITAEQIACKFLSTPDVTECRSLFTFDYYAGDITTGSTVPSEIGLLTQLTYLDFMSNGLTSTIPSEIGLLTQMKWLSFWTNQLTSSIPSEIGLLTQLTHLNFSSNRLTSAIPSEIGILSQLRGLYFTSNQFTSAIPSEIGLLSQLTELGLAANELEGAIPSSLCSVPSITIWIDCGEIACASGCCTSGNHVTTTMCDR